MSSQTTNYSLHKIDLNDSPPDITVLNANWDVIDAELAGHAAKLDELGSVDANPVVDVSISGKVVTITFADGKTEKLTTQDTTYGNATTSAAGLMSAADKTKLDGITANAACMLPYATCSTGKNTVAKVATVTNGVPFSLTVGTVVAVKFTNGLSSSGIYYNFEFSTLNVNSTGTKTVKMIYHKGTDDVVPQHSNNTYLFMYDGTYWNALSALHQRYNTAAGN